MFWPGESHGQRSLVGYSPGGRKESDTTEWLNNSSSSSLAPGSFLAVCAGDGVEIVSKSSSFIQKHVLNNTFKARAGPSGSKVEEHALTFKYLGVWREEKKSVSGGRWRGGASGEHSKGGWAQTWWWAKPAVFQTPPHTLPCLEASMLLLLSRFSRVQLSATPYVAAHQALPSLGFSRQEHWSGLPFSSPEMSPIGHGKIFYDTTLWQYLCNHILETVLLTCDMITKGKCTIYTNNYVPQKSQFLREEKHMEKKTRKRNYKIVITILAR